ncbi:hypothetical protein [Hoeflea sp. AS16]|uniref:hypothetical protein n=1 Tax=Hoeflea sp. AS16 TaxID=3135779 RepID=UPI003173552C
MSNDKIIVIAYLYRRFLDLLPRNPKKYNLPNNFLGLIDDNEISISNQKEISSDYILIEEFRNHIKNRIDILCIDEKEYLDYKCDNMFDFRLREIAYDLEIELEKDNSFLDLLIALAVDNDRIFAEKRPRGKPSLREGKGLREVQEYLLLANQLRAFLQIIRRTQNVSNGQLAKEIIARKLDPNRRGLECQIAPLIDDEEYRATEQKLRRYHRRHQQEFGDGEKRPKRSATNNMPLNVTCERGISAYPWQLSETEIKGADGWQEEYKRVRMKWLPVGRE